MGSLTRFNLAKLKKQAGADYFFETGTWRGDGLAYAARENFRKLFSSEIIASIASQAQERFRNDSRITIINDSSTSALDKYLGLVDGNCIFWLDAHYPGAEEGIKGYNDEEEEFVKLPLQKELELIAARTGRYQDLILVDDLRIYEEGPFRKGNLPKDVLPPKVRNTHFVTNLFKNTHEISKLYEDEGYMVLLPKNLQPLSFFDNIRYRIYNTAFRKIA